MKLIKWKTVNQGSINTKRKDFEKNAKTQMSVAELIEKHKLLKSIKSKKKTNKRQIHPTSKEKYHHLECNTYEKMNKLPIF